MTEENVTPVVDETAPVVEEVTPVNEETVDEETVADATTEEA
jgi:hypothetical protein